LLTEKSHTAIFLIKKFPVRLLYESIAMKKILLIIFSFIFVLCLSSVLTNAAQVGTSFKFSTIETDHFTIHFHQDLIDVAKKVAKIAEITHKALTEEFGWIPSEKTQIVLIDNSDFANAYTTVLPYNTIYVHVVPPSIEMTIGEYEDWLKVIIVHEYAHILTIDPSRGYSKVMRKIFGKPIPGNDLLSLILFIVTGPPNVFLPPWWLEGIATWAETEYTGIGRGRSTYVDMIYRMAVKEDNIPTVDRINGDVPDWPNGYMPYIFGLSLHKYIADKYGKESLRRLNIMHSGRFPYFLNSVPARLFRGKNYVSLYYEMIEDLRKEEGGGIKELEKLPFTPFKTLDISGEILTNPRYSPNGNLLAYNRHEPHNHDVIMLSGIDGSNTKVATRRLPSDSTITWATDSSKIYFCQAEIVRGFNIYQDLYSYDIKGRKIDRLTKGLRVKDPDLSPDGKRFSIVITKNGNQNLALLDLEGNLEKDGKKIEVLTDFKLMRLSGPRWSPDGTSIVYTIRHNDGKSGLYLYNVSEKTHARLLEDSFTIVYPTWSRDGQFIIYTSDETGVYNLFAYSVNDGRRYQITHVLGGVFQPDVSIDGKGIIFSTYNSRGFKIAVMEYGPMEWMPSAGPSIKTNWVKNIEIDITAQEDEIEMTEPRPYKAINTLTPRFWLPTMGVDHDGVVGGVFTAAQDVLGYNTYQVELSSGLSSNKFYYEAIYLNDYVYPTFLLHTRSKPVLYSDLLGKGDYFERNSSLMMGASIPINYLEMKFRFTLGYKWQKQEALSELDRGRFHGVEVSEGRRDYIFTDIEFSNSLKYPYSISYEEGRRISLSYRHYSMFSGSDLNSKEYIADYSEYLRLPFSGNLRHSVLYFKMRGAIASGDLIPQQAFQLGGTILESEFPLRGYPSRSSAGKYATTATLEYRMPIWYILKGWNTKPFFWDRLHTAVFYDLGEVWDDNNEFYLNKLKTGAGMEARFDMTLGYLIKITPAVGLAQGFNEDGETRIYFTIYSDLQYP